jgi:hypothetical protein
MKLAILGCVLGLALALPVTAEAQCSQQDLRGRWDVYGFLDSAANVEGTLSCVFVLNRIGRFSDAVCAALASGGESGGSVNRGRLTVRGNCAVRGQIRNVDTCSLSGTMTRSKDMIAGVYDCGFDEVGLMTMVRR